MAVYSEFLYLKNRMESFMDNLVRMADRTSDSELERRIEPFLWKAERLYSSLEELRPTKQMDDSEVIYNLWERKRGHFIVMEHKLISVVIEAWDTFNEDSFELNVPLVLTLCKLIGCDYNEEIEDDGCIRCSRFPKKDTY